jgi:TolB protein
MSNVRGARGRTFLGFSLSFIILLPLMTILIVSLVFPSLAQSQANAAFPGLNGKIAFVSSDALYTMNPDGTNKTLLTGQGQLLGNPEWSADGKKIVFRSGYEESRLRIINSDGTGDRIIGQADWDQGCLGGASWSPDGTKLIYYKCLGETAAEIYVMNDNGTDLERLTFNNATDWSPSWSPDGEKMVFVSDRNGNPDIYVMNADGTNQTQLTDNPDWDVSPDWSPDGTRVVYVSYQELAGGKSDVYVMNADGSNKENLTNDPSVYHHTPAWSPDGKEIVFEAGGEIYVMGSDGNVKTNISNSAGSGSEFEDTTPSWGPAEISTGVIADVANQATGQSMFSGGRTFYGERFGPDSTLIGNVIDCITVEMRKHGSPTGFAEVGLYRIFPTGLKPELTNEVFGEIDASTLTTGYKPYEFCTTGAKIFELNMVGVHYEDGDPINRIDVRRSNVGAGPDFDGLESYHVNYDGSWHVYNTESNSRDLLFRLTNGMISASITPGSSSKTDDAYSPNPIIVSVGDTVTWTNKDAQPHTVTSGTNFNPILAPGDSFSHTFEETGKFQYYCGLHPNMVGTMVVVP